MQRVPHIHTGIRKKKDAPFLIVMIPASRSEKNELGLLPDCLRNDLEDHLKDECRNEKKQIEIQNIPVRRQMKSAGFKIIQRNINIL